jgi:hypothetical protein
MIGAWLQRIQVRLGIGAARLQDPTRKEGVWEQLFRWWP